MLLFPLLRRSSEPIATAAASTKRIAHAAAGTATTTTGKAALAAAERGVSEAHVTSAAKLTQKEIDALKASLKRALGRDIEIRTDVDPAVLGGLIVQVGSRMFDSSLRTKLDGLRTAMKEA